MTASCMVTHVMKYYIKFLRGSTCCSPSARECEDSASEREAIGTAAEIKSGNSLVQKQTSTDSRANFSGSLRKGYSTVSFAVQ